MKKLLYFVALVCLSGNLWAQAVRYKDLASSVANVAGVPVVTPLPGATVSVCNYPSSGIPCTNLATLYTSYAGTTACIGSNGCSNPFKSDAYGNVQFWAAPGHYAYTIKTQSGKNFGPYEITLGGGSGSGSIQVNSVTQTAANLNGSSPAAPSGYTNVTWQASSGQVTGYVPSGIQLNVANTFTQPQSALCINGKCDEKLFSGSTLATRLTNACAQFSGKGGIVTIPIDESDTTFSLAVTREGCTVEDHRGIILQTTQGQYQTGSGASAAEGISEYMQSNTATSTCCTDRFMHQWTFEANSGGYNTWNGVSGTKTNWGPFFFNEIARTPGQHVTHSVNVTNFSGLGDTIDEGWTGYSNGTQAQGGDEGLEIVSAGLYQGMPASTFTVTAINGSTLTLSCGANCNQLGEQQQLVVTNRGVDSTGTVTSITGQPSVVVGSGTSWTSDCTGNPAGVYLEMQAEAYNGYHIVPQVLTCTDNTHLTLNIPTEGVNGSYGGNVTSGAYYLYTHASLITAVPYTGGVYTTTYATVADPTQFQVGDSVMLPGAAQGSIQAFHLSLYQNHPYNGNAGSSFFSLFSNGNYPIRDGIIMAGPVYDSMMTLEPYNTIPFMGIDYLGAPPAYGVLRVQDNTSRSSVYNLIDVEDKNSADQTFKFDQANATFLFSSPIKFGPSAAAALWGVDSGGNVNAAGSIANSAAALGTYQNLLKYSQFDSGNGVWLVNGGCTLTITANTTDFTDPQGTNTAEKVVNGATGCSPGEQYQSVAGGMTAGLSYTLSFYARGASGGETFSLNTIVGGNAYGSSAISLTTAWKRYSFTFTPTGSTSPTVYANLSTASGTYYIWGAQLEQASGAGAYVHTTSAYASAASGGYIAGPLSVMQLDQVTGSNFAGQISLSSATSNSVTFAKAYNSAPICSLVPTSDPTSVGTYWVTTSTTAVTANVHTSGTITFNYICVGNPN